MGYLPLSPSISFKERQSMTRLKLISARAGVEEADSLATHSHPHSSEPGKKFETMALKWLIKKGRNP
jgi:hypothetical protein